MQILPNFYFLGCKVPLSDIRFDCVDEPAYVLCGDCEVKNVHKERDLCRNISWYGTPNLTKFGELVNYEMFWVITEIVSEMNITKRVRILKQFIKVRILITKLYFQNINCHFFFRLLNIALKILKIIILCLPLPLV